MMPEKLIAILKEAGVSGWELDEVTEEGWEFYFIRRSLDQNRARAVRNITLKVYQRIGDGEALGSASAVLAPTLSEEELRRTVEALAWQATLVPNRPYTLRAPSGEHRGGPFGKPAEAAGLARRFLETFDALPETETEFLNSYEIFASAVTRRFRNSEGIDFTEHYPSGMVEAVVNARRGDREIELYRLWNCGSCDAEGLTRDLRRAMDYGRDRLLAGPTPALGRADLVLSTDDARQVCDYFVSRLNAGLVYPHMSDWTLGKPIVQQPRGDAVTVKALRELPNSSRNRSFDAEGAPIRDLVLLRDGVPEHYLGNRMFSSYLGLEDSFIPGNIRLEGGSRTAEELRRGPCLEVVEFSDFHVDPVTGDVFGEIRLAYWRDGANCVPVTGGSVSGNMADFLQELYLSRETVQYDNMRLPAVIRLAGATVAGIET